jgi:hypothetical protein
VLDADRHEGLCRSPQGCGALGEQQADPPGDEENRHSRTVARHLNAAVPLASAGAVIFRSFCKRPAPRRPVHERLSGEHATLPAAYGGQASSALYALSAIDISDRE